MTSTVRVHVAAGVVTAVTLLVATGAGPSASSAGGRVVAIGDVHGSDEGLLAILRTAGVVDRDSHWSGGTATLVQTGDVTDRGAAVRRVFDLLRALSNEAPKAGGRVLPVLGNHEVMNLVGEIRDVTPAICASFGGGDPEATRETAWRTYSDLAARRTRLRVGEMPRALVRTRDDFRQAYPSGCVEYRLALGPHGTYGRWLRSLPIAVNVQGTVFMHAGLSPLAGRQTVDELNARARDELRRFDRFLEQLARADLAAPWFRLEDVLAVAAAEVRWADSRIAAARARGVPAELSEDDLALAREASAILGIGEWSLLAGDGPLWYRGYATADEAALLAPFTALLTHWSAERLVVGHTPSQPFRIKTRLDGRLFLIDTGMLTTVYKGIASALELDGGHATAIYADGTRTVLAPAP